MNNSLSASEKIKARFQVARTKITGPLTHHKGFTVVECMIAVAIIGIVLAIGIPQYIEYLKRSKVPGSVGFTKCGNDVLEPQGYIMTRYTKDKEILIAAASQGQEPFTASFDLLNDSVGLSWYGQHFRIETGNAMSPKNRQMTEGLKKCYSEHIGPIKPVQIGPAVDPITLPAATRQ